MQALSRHAIAFVVGLTLLAGCDFGDGGLTSRARFEKTVAFEPRGILRLENVNGRVTLEPWDQASLQIEAEKAAPSDDLLEDMRIEVRGEGSRVEVKTHLPRGGLFWGGRGKVDYLVRLPAQARAEVRTINGTVRADGMAGEVRASTVNGSVRIKESDGVVDASTVNGGIEVSYRKLPAEGRHSSTTTNGSVTLYLPEDPAGEFDARTVNGGITTDFPLEVGGVIGRRHLKGRLRDGAASFYVRTVNGSVKILKAPKEKFVWLDAPAARRTFLRKSPPTPRRTRDRTGPDNSPTRWPTSARRAVDG